MIIWFLVLFRFGSIRFLFFVFFESSPFLSMVNDAHLVVSAGLGGNSRAGNTVHEGQRDPAGGPAPSGGIGASNVPGRESSPGDGGWTR